MVATERELRDFAAGRLADFKVPRKVVILAEIPKGATGKLQRIGLAEKLGLGAMRICIFGAGAIGGLLGARLAQAGAEVVADRARAASGGDARARPRPCARPRRPSPSGRAPPTTRRASAPQDYVVVTLKAHQVPGAVAADAAAARPRDRRGHGA